MKRSSYHGDVILICQVFSSDAQKKKAVEAVDEAEQGRRAKMEMLNQVEKGGRCAYS
jgi:hypothetical protein